MDIGLQLSKCGYCCLQLTIATTAQGQRSGQGANILLTLSRVQSEGVSCRCSSQKWQDAQQDSTQEPVQDQVSRSEWQPSAIWFTVVMMSLMTSPAPENSPVPVASFPPVQPMTLRDQLGSRPAPAPPPPARGLDAA